MLRKVKRQMFPTHVGMNRWRAMCTRQWRMFPTHVGMNRLTKFEYPTVHHVPHACGDEPNERMEKIGIAACSPRELCWNLYNPLKAQTA